MGLSRIGHDGNQCTAHELRNHLRYSPKTCLKHASLPSEGLPSWVNKQSWIPTSNCLQKGMRVYYIITRYGKVEPSPATSFHILRRMNLCTSPPVHNDILSMIIFHSWTRNRRTLVRQNTIPLSGLGQNRSTGRSTFIEAQSSSVSTHLTPGIIERTLYVQ